MSNKKLHAFEAEKLTSTEAAILIDIEGERFWFPESQIREDPNNKGHYTISEWLAKEKGLI